MRAILASLVGSVIVLSPAAPDDATFGGPELTLPGTVVAHDAPALPHVAATGWLVADADTGDVLAAHNAHRRTPPASTLKLLTAVTLIAGLDPELTYEATEADATVEGSRVGLVPEEEYTFDDLTHGLILASGNDAAHAIAEISGGQDTAIAAMNAEAKRLGAVNTVARTPHGLDEPGQVTSAYDLALIARAVLADPDLTTLVGTERYDFPGLDDTTFQIQNRNRLLGGYDAAIGLKTGYTTEAGHTIAAAAERDGVRLIVTALDPDEGRAEPVVEALLDWGFGAVGTAEPVGTLVTPEEVARHEATPAAVETTEEPAVDPSAPDEPSAEATPRRHVGIHPASLVAAGGGALALVVVVIALLLRRRRNRRRNGRYAA